VVGATELDWGLGQDQWRKAFYGRMMHLSVMN